MILRGYESQKRESFKRKLTHEERMKEKGRRLSTKEGLYSTITGTILTRFISPFAIALNASNATIAMLSSIPGILGPLTQTFSTRLIEKYSRKKIIVNAVLYEILMWLPIILLAYLFHNNIAVELLPILLIAFISLRIIVASIGAPAWFSWMGDLTEENHRGKYFSKRDRYFSIITILVALLGAFFLDYFRASNMIMLGFGIFFFIAMVSRSISRHYISKQYEPKIKIDRKSYFTFWEFIGKINGNNFGKYTLYNGLLHFSVVIASPFFAVYMLRNLGFSYLTFVLVSLAPIFFHIPASFMWGKITDKFGGYAVLKITTFMIAIMPILWIFSNNILYLIFVPQLLAGFGWSGYHLASRNFIYASVKPKKRAVAVAYYDLIMGMGIFLGAAIGAIIVKYFSSITFMEIILLIFLISGVLRSVVSVIMIPKFKEVRDVPKASSEKILEDALFHNIGFHGNNHTQNLVNGHN